MKSRVSKWGNSLAIRIPRSYALRLGLAEGTVVDLAENNTALVVRKPTFRLEDLLAQITDDNLHDEVAWGRPKGKETR